MAKPRKFGLLNANFIYYYVEENDWKNWEKFPEDVALLSPFFISSPSALYRKTPESIS